MPRKLRIAPSILAADYARLGQEVEAVLQAGADWLHLDIMDGHFVPNISYGADVVAALRPLTDVCFDTHLMIAPADPYLAGFAESGADIITVHAEAGPHLHRSLQAVRALGKKAGVAINPGTSEKVLAPIMELVDLVLVMSVNPGFGGQAFIPETLSKVRALRQMIGDRSIDIEMDGGISPQTAGEATAAGVNVLVAGSAVFKGSGVEDYRRNITALREAAEAGQART